MKNPIKSKTINFGLIVIILGAVQTMLPSLQKTLGDWYGPVLFLIGVIVIVLRAVTKEPLGVSKG